MITEEQVKFLVNGLIDAMDDNTAGFPEAQLRMRKHGIGIAILHIKAQLLGEFAPANYEKYDLQSELITA